MTSFPIQMHPNTTQRHKCFSATFYIWTMFFGYLHMYEQKKNYSSFYYILSGYWNMQTWKCRVKGKNKLWAWKSIFCVTTFTVQHSLNSWSLLSCHVFKWCSGIVLQTGFLKSSCLTATLLPLSISVEASVNSRRFLDSMSGWLDIFPSCLTNVTFCCRFIVLGLTDKQNWTENKLIIRHLLVNIWKCREKRNVVQVYTKSFCNNNKKLNKLTDELKLKMRQL